MQAVVTAQVMAVDAMLVRLIVADDVIIPGDYAGGRVSTGCGGGLKLCRFSIGCGGGCCVGTTRSGG